MSNLQKVIAKAKELGLEVDIREFDTVITFGVVKVKVCYGYAKCRAILIYDHSTEGWGCNVLTGEVEDENEELLWMYQKECSFEELVARTDKMVKTLVITPENIFNKLLRPEEVCPPVFTSYKEPQWGDRVAANEPKEIVWNNQFKYLAVDSNPIKPVPASCFYFVTANVTFYNAVNEDIFINTTIEGVPPQTNDEAVQFLALVEKAVADIVANTIENAPQFTVLVTSINKL